MDHDDLNTYFQNSSNTDLRRTQILQALQTSQDRNVFIKVDGKNTSPSLYYLNTEFERQTVRNVSISEPQSEFEPWEPVGERSNIYSLYEQNIGILTPIVAEKIGEAEQRYPLEWIEEAISEAVSLNSRNWRYISRILERWEIEGKADGESRKHTGKARYI